MPVRGTTKWQHAIIEKKIINRDEGGWGTVTSSGTHYLMCAWSYCERDATTLYQVVVNDGADGYERKPYTYAFCSERCKQEWLDELRRIRARGC